MQCAYPYCLEKGKWELTMHVPAKGLKPKDGHIEEVKELAESLTQMRVSVAADGLFCDYHTSPTTGKHVLGITAREQLEKFFEERGSEPDFDMTLFSFNLPKNPYEYDG